MLTPNAPQLRLGKVDAAKASLKIADALLDRSVGDDRRMMESYSVDGGGEHFKAMWADLEQLSAGGGAN